MKNLIVILIGSFLLVNCTNQKNESSENRNIKDTIVYHSDKTKFIDSLGLTKQFNKTKWFLYSRYCDEKVQFTKESLIYDTSITFASLDLKFDTLILYKDTCEINFRFYYKNLLCDHRLIYNYQVLWGAVFKIPSDSILKFSGRSSARYFSFHSANPLKSRYENFAHPDVIKYVNANKSKLNPWFLAEAEQRGLIKK